MSTSESPKTAKSSQSTFSLKTTQAVSPIRGLPAWLMTSFSESTTSESRRICRICQMHEGSMVRPCDCAGTMGDVHEECLTKWVNMSNKKSCEICKSEYAKSGQQFKPLRAWSKPKVDSVLVCHFLIIILLSVMIAYVITVLEERKFHERVIQNSYFSRPDDSGKILLCVVLSAAILNNIYSLSITAINYLKRQREICFIDKHTT